MPTLATDLNSPDRGLAVIDDEDIDTFLVGDQGRLRDDHLFFRLAAFEVDAHQLAVDQRAGWIGNVARTRTVSVVRSTVTSTKLIEPC